MKLIFMGSPAFAVPTLQTLIDSPHDLAVVYAQPPRPAGRGYKLTPCPTHALAESHGIPVETPRSLKSPEAQERFRSYGADIAVVIAYGLILPQAILDTPRLGCINVHPSELPRWRGAAPIQRTVMEGDRETAICIMQMDAGLDTGDVLLRKHYSILPGTTAGQLHDQLAAEAGPLILQTLAALEDGTATPVPQPDEETTYAAKIDKAEARIDWGKPAERVLAHIHGLSPYPGAWMQLPDGGKLKILRAGLAAASAAAGTTLDDRLTVACSSGAIQPTLVQKEGKQPMPLADFLRGNPIPAGTRF